MPKRGKVIPRTDRILLRSPNWVGDALLTTPVVHSIKKAFPDSRITVLAKPWVAPVFEANPSVEEVVLYEKPGRHGGRRGRAVLAQELRDQGYDLVIHFPHSFESALISFWSRIPVRIGFATEGRGFLLTHRLRQTPARMKEHQAAYFFHLLEPLGLTEEPSPESHPLQLTIPPAGRQKAETLLEGLGIRPSACLVALAPGAIYGSAKCWPLDRFAELARRLKKEWQAEVLLLGTAQDASSGHLRNPEGLHDLTGKTSLGEALALIERCRLIVCNDSGLMHAASALNIPLLALFGSTDVRRTGPWGSRYRVVTKRFPCAPCLKKTCTVSPNCLETLSLDEVWEALSAFRAQEGC